MNNPEGYVLVQVKQLAQWREWANNVAAWSTKSDRSSEVARLKASISGAMVSATQPTASNAGVREDEPAGVKTLREALALQGVPIGNMVDRHTAIDRTLKARSAWQSACTTDAIKWLLDRAALAIKPPAGEQKPVGHVDVLALRLFTGSASDHTVKLCHKPKPGDVALYTAPLPEQVAQDREHAENYRLIRRGQHWSVVDGIGNTLRGEDLDTAVDAIRAARARGEGGPKG